MKVMEERARIIYSKDIFPLKSIYIKDINVWVIAEDEHSMLKEQEENGYKPYHRD